MEPYPPERLSATPLENEAPEEKFDSLLENRELIHKAFEKGTRIISKESIDPNEFEDVYSKTDIAEDMARVTVREAQFAERKKFQSETEVLIEQMATAAEALIYQEIGVGGWLSGAGINVRVEKTSRPDDILNGVDIVLTFLTETQEELFALSIDVRTGTQGVSEKIHTIKQQLDIGKLARVKYHENPDGTHSPLEDIPRAVLMINGGDLLTLIKLWVKDDIESKNLLHRHPIQYLFIEEIQMQLAAYGTYAEQKKLPVAVIEKIKAAQTIFDTLHTTKKPPEGSPLKLSYAKTLSALRNALNLFIPHKENIDKLRKRTFAELQRDNIIKRLQI